MPSDMAEVANICSLSPFPEGWYFIGTHRNLQKSEPYSAMWMGQKIVAWCNDHGDVCVAEAVCPHLGSDLSADAGARVVAGQLVCPFHGFEFDVTGQCVATPSDDPARSTKLRLFETRNIGGLIFAWWGFGGREPQWQLPHVPPNDGDWSDLALRTVRFPGHPQETSENSVDIAHLSYIHGYDNVTSDAPVSIEGPCLESRFGFATTRKIAKIGKLTLEVSAVARVIGLGYSYVEFRERSIGMDARLWVLATPIDGTLIDLTIVSSVRELREPKRPIAGLKFLPRQLRAPILNKFVADFQIRDVKQDVVIWSRKHYVPRPRLVRSDGEVMKYRAYCAQFYPEPGQCQSPAR
ncbi:Rieske 2Fe-2S domain-containing protein [Candidatus Poriferisodalis sp.]|uniref:Rieske 2Fe-2S domain-containing protein n=1 Tax=Candidatus Poriferisodalis sp. TaxID=3101277 RepID=UPI003B019980